MENTKQLSIKDIFIRLMKDRISASALVVLSLYLIIAVVGEVYGIYCRNNDVSPGYDRQAMEERFEPPSGKHLLGTDYQGRDVFIRGLFGTKTAIKVGLLASILSTLIGVTLGALAGYFGGWLDDVVVWIYSTFASMPTLLFILAFAILVNKGFLCSPLADLFKGMSDDPGMLALYLGIGITGWVSLCRVVRAETLKIREMQYIQSAQALGYSSARIIFKHIVPNLFHLVIIYFTMRFAYAIMTEVIVSYLGFGVQMEPSWGVMISNGQEKLWQGIWWEVAAGTGFMFFLVLSLNILGDALRDILDPKLET